MPTTVAQLIEETRRLLYGTSRLTLNRLAALQPQGNPGLTLELNVNDVTRGAIISIDDEIQYVIESIPAAKTAQVIRGYLGTTDVEHSVGALVEVNPRFPRVYIKRALQQEIDSWGTRLYRATTIDIPLSSSTLVYDLAGVTNFVNIIDIKFPAYPGRTTRTGPFRWQLLRDMPVADFPSGSAIELTSGGPTSGSMRVVIAQEFDVSNWTDSTDVEALGLSPAMCAIPPVGAAWRLMSAKEVGRTNMTAQPEPRKADEVPAGHMSSVAAQLKKLRDDLIDEERWTLMNRYPLKGVA